ncbi:MAG: M15 family metallopeptidase [Lachnospirales bacterium]
MSDSSSRRKRKEQIRRRQIWFTIVVVFLLAFLVWYLVGYLPARDSSQESAIEDSSTAQLEESSVPDSLTEETSSAAEESVGGDESSAPAESAPEESSSEESSLSEEPSQPEESSGSEEPSTEKDVDEILGMEYVTVDPDATDWNLLLVNKTHRLAENLEMETKQIFSEEVDARIYDNLVQMLEDGERDSDRQFLVCSGYRSVDFQQTLFDNKIAEIQAEHPEYTYEEAYIEASTIVAIPGASEHNTGLTVDICAMDFQMLIEEYEETEEAKWLKENCYKYGFILRYPKGKEDITQIIYEPWHFRYVGVEAATEIMTQGITLEEYLGEVD